MPKFAAKGNTPGNQSPGAKDHPVSYPTTPSSMPPNVKAIPTNPKQDKRPK